MSDKIHKQTLTLPRMDTVFYLGGGSLTSYLFAVFHYADITSNPPKKKLKKKNKKIRITLNFIRTLKYLSFSIYFLAAATIRNNVQLIAFN